MCSVQCALCTVRSAVCNVQKEICLFQCVVCSMLCAVCSVPPGIITARPGAPVVGLSCLGETLANCCGLQCSSEVKHSVGSYEGSSLGRHELGGS